MALHGSLLALVAFPLAACAAALQPSQPPVPAGVAPQPSSAQPYVYRKVDDRFYVIAEIHQPFPRDETSNPPHTQQMGLFIGDRRAALIDCSACWSAVSCPSAGVTNTSRATIEPRGRVMRETPGERAARLSL